MYVRALRCHPVGHDSGLHQVPQAQGTGKRGLISRREEGHEIKDTGNGSASIALANKTRDLARNGRCEAILSANSSSDFVLFLLIHQFWPYLIFPPFLCLTCSLGHCYVDLISQLIGHFDWSPFPIFKPTQQFPYAFVLIFYLFF
jgi:hypothetical protein